MIGAWVPVLVPAVLLFAGWLRLVFFRPWRVKRTACWLMRRWAWYDQRVRLLVIRHMTKLTINVTIAIRDNLTPAIQQAHESFKRFAAAYEAAQS